MDDVIKVDVFIKHDDNVVKGMLANRDNKEETKEVMTRTTNGKEEKDASRWWDVQLNRGEHSATVSISSLTKDKWLIQRINRFWVHT